MKKWQMPTSVAIGLIVFLIWLQLVGPQIHVVESALGLLIGIVVAGFTYWKIRPRG